MIKLGNEVLFKDRLYTVENFVKNKEGDFDLQLKAVDHDFEVFTPINPLLVEEVDMDFEDITTDDLSEYMHGFYP